MAELLIYGIRHHGPGSARALLAALERDRPDVLAIEMPADLEKELHRIGSQDLVPPVALVSYDPKYVSKALYYPLARFSPEWVAMRWAAAQQIPIKAIDLPAPLMIAVADQMQQRPSLEQQEEKKRKIQVDPLGELARLAGYSDRERWWERTFEMLNPGADIFEATLNMITELRNAYPEATDYECRFREMHMAKLLLDIEKDGAQKIGVVCGAWHGPVLAKAELKQTSKGYTQAKRGLKGPKLEQTWIPWTYERLRSGAGYGAGVASPVWYGLLYDNPRLAPEHYLSLIASELRQMGYAASTAQVVDATDLAHQLSELRQLALPGIDELSEAAKGALAEGSSERLSLVLKGVESMRTTGRVPTDFRSLPLQQDLEARLKEVRLLKPYKDMEKVSKDLDLRKPAHLSASQLLCQLLLLGIPFGHRKDAAQGAQGTFKESWVLHWQPDFALLLLASHTYGQTIEVAASAALRERMDQEPDLPSLADAIDLVIVSGLFGEMADVAQRIHDKAADTVDVWIIARALPAILRVARYASLRVQETSYLSDLIYALVPKLSAGLPMACSNLDEEAAYTNFRLLKVLQPALAMLDEQRFVKQWYAAISKVAFGVKTHPLLGGFALRTLSDAEELIPAETAKWIGLNLGAGVALQQSAHFIEGFLYSSGTVLIHQPAIFELLDRWLLSLKPDEFRSQLPALRRTFAEFSSSDRRKLAALARKANQNATAHNPQHELLPLSEGLKDQLKRWLSPKPAV